MGLLILLAYAAAIVTVLGTLGLIVRMHRPHRRTLASALAQKQPTEPSEAGLTGVETTFTFADGSTSPGWILDGKKPAGPLVVVLHGWSSSRFSGLRRAARLAPFAGRLVVCDLRAHGDSTARTCMFGKLECDDLVRVVEQADHATGERRPIVLVGASMGAGFAMWSAARGPADFRARVVGIVADGPYRRPMEPVANHLRTLGWPAEPFCLLTGLYLAVRLRMTPGRFDRATLASELDCPLLVLHGSDDPISPITSAREIAGAAKMGTLVEFAGGGHGGLAALDEQRYNRALAEFFATLGTTDRSDTIKRLGLSESPILDGAADVEHPRTA